VLPGGVTYLGGRHVEELGARVHEAADEPGAGDAVDLRALARDPARGGTLGLGVKRPTGGAPGFDAAFQVARAERPGDVLADLMAVHAVDDHRSFLRQ
jgi:hypothetical protein